MDHFTVRRISDEEWLGSIIGKRAKARDGFDTREGTIALACLTSFTLKYSDGKHQKFPWLNLIGVAK